MILKGCFQPKPFYDSVSKKLIILKERSFTAFMEEVHFILS